MDRLISSKEIFLSSLKETEQLGKKLAKTISPSDVFAFFGEVGAGKTTLIKSIVNSLGYPIEDIVSPTFTYLNVYETASISCYHFDLYRFESESDFLQKGFDEYFDMEGICLIEWAEKIPNLLPDKTKVIRLKHSDKGRICIID